MARLAVIVRRSNGWRVAAHLPVGSVDSGFFVAGGLHHLRQRLAGRGDAQRDVRGILIDDNGSITDISAVLEDVATWVAANRHCLHTASVGRFDWLGNADQIATQQRLAEWHLSDAALDKAFTGGLDDLLWGGEEPPVEAQAARAMALAV